MARRTIDNRLRRSDKIVQSRPAQRVEGGHTPRLKDAATEEVRRVFAEQIRDLQKRIEDLERTKQSVVTADGGFVPKGYVNGLNLQWISATEIQVSAGEATDSEDEVVLVHPSTETYSWDQLDTGVEGSSTLYAVYLVGPASGGNGRIVFSTQWDTPGYFGPNRKANERYRYIGAFYNDSSSDILEFTQSGEGRTRYMLYWNLGATAIVSNLGSSSGAAASVTFSPPSAKMLNVEVYYDPASVGNTFRLYHPDAFNGGGIYQARDSSHNSAGRYYGTFTLPTDGASIYYQTDNSAGRLYIYMQGYWDSI